MYINLIVLVSFVICNLFFSIPITFFSSFSLSLTLLLLQGFLHTLLLHRSIYLPLYVLICLLSAYAFCFFFLFLDFLYSLIHLSVCQLACLSLAGRLSVCLPYRLPRYSVKGLVTVEDLLTFLTIYPFAVLPYGQNPKSIATWLETRRFSGCRNGRAGPLFATFMHWLLHHYGRDGQ